MLLINRFICIDKNITKTLKLILKIIKIKYMNDDKHITNRIFISYSHQDKEVAQKLYTFFKDRNLNPWLDEEELLPGMKWKEKINDAIRDSRYFIPLLSRNSTKGGSYVEKELNEAKQNLKKYTDEIYLIPIRIDDCQVLDSTIQEFQIVDLSQDWDRGLKKILQSMGETDTFKDDFVEYWEPLIIAIDEKKCIPFIGEGALEIFNEKDDKNFFTSREIAAEWTQQYGYPLEDFFQLPKVAQFLAVEKDDLFPKQKLKEILKKHPKPDFNNRHRNTTQAILSKLNLPIYITTNYDNLMEEALRNDNKNPDTEWCRWNDTLVEYTKDGAFPSLFTKGSKYKGPTESQPLVYHLHGSMDEPASMVLTERDYFTFVINMNKIEEESIRLPKLLRTRIPPFTLLFIGFHPGDKSFISVLQGALSFCSTTRTFANTFAVIQIPNPRSFEKRNKELNYLKKYYNNMFNIHVYWGTPEEFVDELQRKWNKFKENSRSS